MLAAGVFRRQPLLGDIRVRVVLHQRADRPWGSPDIVGQPDRQYRHFDGGIAGTGAHQRIVEKILMVEAPLCPVTENSCRKGFAQSHPAGRPAKNGGHRQPDNMHHEEVLPRSVGVAPVAGEARHHAITFKPLRHATYSGGLAAKGLTDPDHWRVRALPRQAAAWRLACRNAPSRAC